MLFTNGNLQYYSHFTGTIQAILHILTCIYSDYARKDVGILYDNKFFKNPVFIIK